MNLIPTAKIHEFAGDARILDLDLARFLELERPTNIRTVIAANRDELTMHGEVCTRQMQTTSKGGRPGNAYYLNEGQALIVCALSRTPKAAQVRKALVDVFMAYRQGKLVHVKEHRRRLPCRQTEGVEFDSVRHALYAFKDQPLALIDILARCVVRIDRLENAS